MFSDLHDLRGVQLRLLNRIEQNRIDKKKVNLEPLDNYFSTIDSAKQCRVCLSAVMLSHIDIIYYIYLLLHTDKYVLKRALFFISSNWRTAYKTVIS